MKNQIIGKNIEVTEGIRSAIEKKLKRMDKYFLINDGVDCRVVVRSYKVGAKVEITIFTSQMVLRAEVTDPDLYACLDYAKNKGYTTYFMMAMPFGTWKDNIMDANDLKILADIRKKYDCCFDTWDMYDPKKERISGCWTVNRTYITPLGDVLVCPYINIKIGNIKEQSLKEILDYGFSIKYFGNYSPMCISAHNREFRKKYLPDAGNIFTPRDAHEIFGKEDYIEDAKE